MATRLPRNGFAKRFKPPAMENMHVAMNWFEELEDPKAKEFVARWRAKFPTETYINDMGQNAYAAIYMYKKLVEMAGGSTKLADHSQDFFASEV